MKASASSTRRSRDIMGLPPVNAEKCRKPQVYVRFCSDWDSRLCYNIWKFQDPIIKGVTSMKQHRFLGLERCDLHDYGHDYRLQKKIRERKNHHEDLYETGLLCGRRHYLVPSALNCCPVRMRKKPTSMQRPLDCA